MSKRKMRLSIDEAGDLGFKFSKEENQSSRYFNMTGVIDDDLKNSSSGDVIKQIAIEVFGKEETKKIHFRNATTIQKQHMVNKVSVQPLKTITVVTDKKYFQQNNIAINEYSYIKKNSKRGFELYIFSLEKLLIEVSNYIEGENIELVVDIAECGGTIKKTMVNKLITKLVEDGKISDKFKSVKVMVANQRCSLQVADIIASSIYSSIEPSQLFIPIYAIALLPIIIRKNVQGIETVLDAGICFTHPYNTEKVIKNYPWFNHGNYIYTMLFPERESEISIN